MLQATCAGTCEGTYGLVPVLRQQSIMLRPLLSLSIPHDEGVAMWRCVHRAGDDGGLMWMADVDRSSQDARESLSSTPRAPVGDQAHWLYRSRRELLASGLLAAASAVVPVLGIPQVRLMPWYGTRSLSVRSGKSCFSLGSAPGDGSRLAVSIPHSEHQPPWTRDPRNTGHPLTPNVASATIKAMYKARACPGGGPGLRV